MNQDLISRKAAIDALCDNCDDVKSVCAHYPCKRYIAIEQLPSAQPERTETHSCDYQRTETHDLVSRSAVLDKVNAWTYNLCDNEDEWAAIKEIKELPSAQPEKKGDKK